MPTNETTHVAAGPEPIVWRVHPAKGRPLATLLVLGVMAGLAWLSAELMQRWWWGVVAGVVLLVGLNRYFWPSEFRIDDSGVSVRRFARTQTMPWSEIRRFQCDRRTGYLSRRRRPSVLDTFEGLVLIFDPDRSAAIARIEHHLECVERTRRTKLN